MKHLMLVIGAACLAAACSMTPTVTRHKTMMTRAQIAALDLECKRLKPIDTNIPRTICASEQSWDAYLDMTVQATQDLFAKAREVR